MSRGSERNANDILGLDPGERVELISTTAVPGKGIRFEFLGLDGVRVRYLTPDEAEAIAAELKTWVIEQRGDVS